MKPLRSKLCTRGFSLIELMIVVAIVAVLSAVAVPQYQDYVTRARWTVNLTQLEPLKLAIAECLQNQGGDTTACDTAGKLGLTALPTPQHASGAITLTATSSSELKVAITGSPAAGNCKVEATGAISDGLLGWVLTNVANGTQAACTRPQTGVGG